MKTYLKIGLLALLLTAVVPLWAAPVGYSVNSDEPDGDKLHVINLANGDAATVGAGLSLSRTDVEGLAFDNQGVLWGVDDESLKLFPIDTGTGLGLISKEISITGLNSLSGNDFGMTFTCDANLFVSSVTSRTLYRLGPDGKAETIGGAGALGVNISALAAWGSPAKLYGLGNGMVTEDGPADNRSLYEINTADGKATLIGPIGPAAGDYLQAGLSFDDDGTLWALTDRRFLANPQGSQALTINTDTGVATLVSTTSVTGFESLAVAQPGGCDAEPPRNIFGSIDGINNVPTLDSWGRGLAILMVLALGLAAFATRRAGN